MTTNSIEGSELADGYALLLWKAIAISHTLLFDQLRG